MWSTDRHHLGAYWHTEYSDPQPLTGNLHFNKILLAFICLLNLEKSWLGVWNGGCGVLSGSLLLPRDEVFIASPLGLSVTDNIRWIFLQRRPQVRRATTPTVMVSSQVCPQPVPSAVTERLRSPDYPQKPCCKHFSVAARVLPLLPSTAPTEHVLREKSPHQNQLQGKPASDTEHPAQVCEQCVCVTRVCPLWSLSVLREKKIHSLKSIC